MRDVIILQRGGGGEGGPTENIFKKWQNDR